MKRFVLCFGGTWNRPERSGMVEGEIQLTFVAGVLGSVLVGVARDKSDLLQSLEW
jgi:hypothetical protein